MGRVIARIKRGKERFEILVDGVRAWEWKEGKIKDIRDVLIVEEIFKDARAGDVASRESMKRNFGTDDPIKIAEIILKEGEVPLPAEYRRRLVERRRKRIVDYISQNAIDPRTNLPIPPSRIESAIEKAKVRIDIERPFEKVLEEVIKKIQPILPIRFEKKRIEISVSPKFSGKIYGYIRRFKILKEKWCDDGSLICLIEVPGGMINEIISDLSSRTSGEVKVRVIKDG